MSIKEIVKIELDADDAKAEARSFQSSFTKSMVAASLATKAIEKGLSGLTAGLRASIDAAAEYEKTNLRLNAALKSAGLETGTNAKALNEQAAALESVAGISDEAIRSMQALSINMTGSAEATEKLIPAAIRLSNATGITLESAVRNLGKTFGGLTGELGELFPAVKGLTAEQLQNGEAVDLINRMYSDQLTLLQEGLTGEVNRFRNAVASLGEAMVLSASQGSPLNEVLSSFSTTLETVTSALQRFGSLEGVAALLDITFTGGANLGDEFLSGVSPFGQRGTAEGRGGTTDKGGRRKRSGRGGQGGQGGKLQRAKAEASGFGSSGTLSIDGMQVDEATGAILPPDLPDPEVLRQRQEEYEESRRRHGEIILDLEQRKQDGLTETLMANLKLRAEAEEAAAARSNAITEQWTNFGIDAVQGFASQSLDALVAFANGANVEFDQVIKSFLESTGKQIIAMGIKDIAMGVSRGFSSYGFDATAYALVSSGTIATGIGAAMIGGSLVIPPSQGASSSGGAGALSGSAGPAAGGGIGGAGAGNGYTEVRREYVINVFGKPTAELGRFIRDADREARIRGI